MATAELLIEAATRNAVFLEGLKAGEIEKIQPLLLEIDRELRERLSRDDLTAYSRQRFEELLATIEAMLGSLFSGYTDDLLTALYEAGQYEAEFEAASLGQVIVNVSANAASAQAVRTAILTQPLSVTGPDGGKLLQPFIDDWAAAERKRVTGAIRLGYVQGETNQQIIRRLRGTRAAQYRDGILAITQRNAAAVVSTAIQHVAMVGRMETLKANANLVKGYEWVSTLDARTTPTCRSLDGRTFKFGKGPMPPIHVRCRSTITPDIDERFAYLQEGATRASKDGQVDASLTYYQWLKRQSPRFQDEVLGPVRGKLFRDGGLSAERFSTLQLDRNFKPLTLDQLRELEPLAFERAGI